MPRSSAVPVIIAALLVLGLIAATVAIVASEPRASAFAHLVFITHLDCDSNPEVIRITSSEGSSVSLAGFLLQSDPGQEYTLTDFQASISPGETIEFQSGSGAASGPGVYKLTSALILRNDDPSDYARLVRPGASDIQVNCGATPSTTPSPTPPSPTICYFLTTQADPIALGSVSSNPASSGGCPAGQYASGTSVSLTAEETHSGVEFTTWSQDCSGTANPTNVTMNGPKACTANFALLTCPTGAHPAGVVMPQFTCAPTASPTSPPGQQIAWGDNDCDGDNDSVDALQGLRLVAGFGVSQNDPCPKLGTVVEVADASPHVWGDLDCDDDADSVDALQALRHVAGFSVSQGDDCPEIGSTVTVAI